MKNYLLCFAIISTALYAFGQNQISIEPSACFLADCAPFADYPNVEFGYLYVPEDYNDPEGTYIKVAFSLVKSTVADPEPDPVLFFAGGWGLPLVDQTLYYMQRMPVKNRDLIFYDYRGSGYSSPNLCPDLGTQHFESVRQDLDYEAFTRQLQTQFYGCFEELKKQGIDYRLYGTEIKTRDAVHLVEQLGYQEVNLFGISNGTMGIQGFLRAVEEHSTIHIRSIYSDSNVPMARNFAGDKALLYKQVLDQVLDDCANDPDCSSAYPDLKERFHRFLRESLTRPLKHEGQHAMVLNTYEINSVIHQLLYSSPTYKDVPLVLEAFMRGELAFFDVIMESLQDIVTSSNGASVINYTYDWKAEQKEVSQRYHLMREDYPEFMWANFWLAFYVNDTTIGYNPRDTIPVTSDVPALVLAGTYDPITSVESSRIMHARYTNSYYYELQGVGHGVFGTPCGQELLKSFLEAPDKRPDSTCVAAMRSRSIPFTTSLYKNDSVNVLIRRVALQKNILWMSLLLFPLLFSLITLIRESVQAIRKKDASPSRFILSTLILIFLIGLGYYSFQTISLGGLTLLFGLISSAGWLPWMAMAILAAGAYLLYQSIRSSTFSLWKIGLILSAALAGLIAFTYGITPF